MTDRALCERVSSLEMKHQTLDVFLNAGTHWNSGLREKGKDYLLLGVVSVLTLRNKSDKKVHIYIHYAFSFSFY